MRCAVVVAALAVVTMSVETSTVSIDSDLELIQETEKEGPIGCKFWRVRSITNTPGQWWQLKEIEFYASTDGTGDKIAPSKAMASTYKGDINTSPHKAEKAIDGDPETFWSTSDKYKFEWLGVEFDEPKTIGSI